jgi:C4-dicarboxylate-specific signal transduction histidine kinase
LGQWLALLVIVFFVIPLCVVTLWGYLQSRRYLTDAAFRNVRNVAALEAAETLEFVRGAENLVPSLIAGNEHLFETIRSLEESAVGPDRSLHERTLRAHMQRKVQESPSALEFSVLGNSGRLLASSSSVRPVGEDLSQTGCFTQGSTRASIVGFEYEPGGGSGGGHEHSDHDEASPGHEPRLVIGAPIRDSEGRFLGVFCARFTFDIHRRLLLARNERTSRATLFLLDDQNRVVCGSFEDSNGAPYGDRFQDLDSSVLSRGEPWQGRLETTSGGGGDGHDDHDHGHDVIVAYAPIPSLSWGVVVEVPVHEALASIDRLKWQAVAASAALVLVLAVAVFATWRKVVQPVRALSMTSDQMTSGVSGETVEPSGPREIAELGSAFNRMSLALRESHHTLEDRIDERTLELRESQEFTELLLNSIEQRVTVVDREFSILKANAAAERMFGDRVRDAKCHELFEGRSTPCEGCPAARTFETGRPARDERSQSTGNGQEAVLVDTYPVKSPNGDVESVITIGRVVTDEKRLQMQMVHQEKMAAFGLLAAGVAHEIGNPLASIESQLRLAADDPERAEQTLGVVRKDVARIGRLLRELVDFSRRRRDTEMLMSVNQAIEDVVRLLEHDPRARKIEIECELADGLPGVRAKEDHVVQVLMNLGLNALDSMPSGGSLKFVSALEDEEIVVRVRDSGAGIPVDARARVFEPFFTTKELGRGTGLGLFVSRGIVEGMGGRLELEDTGDDGTMFAVRLEGERA